MRHHLPLAMAALVLFLLPLPAPAPAAEDVEGPNILVTVEPATKARFRAIARSGLDIVHAHGNVFEILVDETQLADLRASGDRVAVKDPDVYANLREIKLRRGSLIGNYTTYAEMVTRLQDRAATYPSLCTLQSIGTSWEGRDLWALKISDNPGVAEGEPGVLYLGTYHARELITVEINLALADSLLMNYGTDPRITGWVDDREIWFIPMVNPDGHVYVETTNTNWRKNRRDNPGSSEGVDLNRNHEYEWGHDDNGSEPSFSSPTYRGPSPASEPEVQAVQAFVDAHPNLVFSLSFHSYGDLWLWGPGWKPGMPVDQDIFLGYGTQVAAMNGYYAGNAAMAAIYITNGDADDWLYQSPSHPKIFGMTPEVGAQFYPPESQIPALVLENIEPSYLALEHADRPGRLAPPGQPAIDPIPNSSDGTATVNWSAPTTADVDVVEYEIEQREGPAAVTWDFETGPGGVTPNGWTVSSNRAASGVSSFWSGQGDELNRISLATEGYLVQPGDAYTFQAWYDIETNWDYAYAICSTDGGRSFVNLEGTGTTMSDPNGNNADHGITGASGGWQPMTFDLSAFVGQTVWLGTRYYTDQSVQGEGIYVDDVWPRQTWTTRTVLSSTVGGTSFALSSLPQGEYWYTVRGRDAEGDWGYPSADAKLSVTSSTGVAGLAEAGVLSLAAGVPNPFAGRTEIRFRLPESADHSLVVYDVAGRRVRTLSRGVREPGLHAVGWDGRDDEGRPAPSGVYFYRLRTPLGERQQRVVLTR